MAKARPPHTNVKNCAKRASRAAPLSITPQLVRSAFGFVSDLAAYGWVSGRFKRRPRSIATDSGTIAGVRGRFHRT
jgi:hypothetical protein